MKRLVKWIFSLGILLVIIGAGAAVTVGYFNSRARTIPIVFSSNALLTETYNDYKANNLDPTTGRTIDKSQHNLTTSEGESYTMLRAVYMDDKTTFDDSWQFTQSTLQRPDHLFSWKYGFISGSTYGILTDQGGNNTASDADEDIAMSLLMAYTRWNQPSYLAAAKPIVSSIWNEEVVTVQGKPVLTADNLEKDAATSVVVNPSYFTFANYKLFAKIDPSHDWLGLASNSYDLIASLSSDSLDKTKSDGLPPDWIEINRSTGAFIAAASPNLDTNFGYDAIRIPFRLALDYSWFKDDRDKQVLSRFGYLEQFWNSSGVLNAVVAHDGSVVSPYESPATYGATLGYFELIHPTTAKNIYQTKLQTLYSPDQEAWKAPAPGYYEDNWAWFGIALHLDALPNISEAK